MNSTFCLNTETEFICSGLPPNKHKTLQDIMQFIQLFYVLLVYFYEGHKN